jgi:integrase
VSQKRELTFSVLFTGGIFVRTGYVEPNVFRLLLTALMPANRLALETSMTTGLRISDVLHLKTADLVRTARPTITERKTGKRRRVYFPRALRDALLLQAGRFFIFEGRYDERHPRTRQAVFKDLKRVAKLYRIDGEKIRANVAPHSARKIFAVQDFRAHGNLERVRRLLNHSEEAVTMLYALADRLERKQRRSR